MKVTYLYHSGFSVELEKYLLIFDYYKGPFPRCETDKTVLFFASHKHHDHFDFSIFREGEKQKNCYYFLSSDIKLSDKYLLRNGVNPDVKERIISMGKNTSKMWQDIEIQTLRSTDEGVAFIVSAEGKCIYHAGDLNWWHWEGEDAKDNLQMKQAYEQQMALIKGKVFDVAFVPLDPRLETAYDWGMLSFLAHTDAKKVFPMHMWNKYEIIEAFKSSDKGHPYAEKIISFKKPGEEFIL